MHISPSCLCLCPSEDNCRHLHTAATPTSCAEGSSGELRDGMTLYELGEQTTHTAAHVATFGNIARIVSQSKCSLYFLDTKATKLTLVTLINLFSFVLHALPIASGATKFQTGTVSAKVQLGVNGSKYSALGFSFPTNSTWQKPAAFRGFLNFCRMLPNVFE